MNPYSKTYCNPLSLPDYPRGAWSTPEHKAGRNGFWNIDGYDWDYRELADPSVLYHDGKWYLYPSGSMCWWTEDFVHWHKATLNIEWVGYAPTIVKHGDAFLLCGSGSAIYRSDSPLGPFEELGAMELPDGSPLEGWLDPMLFSDDDGRLYAYWGIRVGIFAAELDTKNPWKIISEPVRHFGYDNTHPWERGGPFNQMDTSCPEGAWMFKHKDTYYLTYGAPGTNPQYAMGVYKSSNPLGPFTYGEESPFMHGYGPTVQGAGHGCIVRGPKDTLWAFYTCHVQIHHMFERRIGMDPVGIDSEGRLFSKGASDTPQWAPGVKADPAQDNATGLLPVSRTERIGASSHLPGREPSYANDYSNKTWWQAAGDDKTPYIIIDLHRPQEVHAMRLHWKEPGLDYDEGITPVAMRYHLEATDSKDPLSTNDWVTVLNQRENTEDRLIDYQAFAPAKYRYFRLTIERPDNGLGIGLIDYSLFAKNSFSDAIE